MLILKIIIINAFKFIFEINVGRYLFNVLKTMFVEKNYSLKKKLVGSFYLPKP